MLKRREKIAFVVGAHADLKAILAGLRWLKEHETPYRALIASLYQLEAVQQWLAQAVSAGVEVFIVAQGGSALLPGIVAAQTLKPVIGVPLDTSRHRGEDARLAMAALPEEQDLLLTRINGVQHAIRAAIRILALADTNYQKLNEELRQQELQEVEIGRKLLLDKYRELLEPPQASAGFAGVITALEQLEVIHTGAAETAAGAAAPPPQTDELATGGNSRVLRVDPNNPDVAVIERAAGQLLNGAVVGLPTDTVYGLAVDATNPAALERLIALKGRGENHPIPVMICNEEQLRLLARNVPAELIRRLDAVWPGPLTLVFDKFPGTFQKISTDDSIGVRIPDHFVMLSILNAVNRPLAVTSANPTGRPPAVRAQELSQYFQSGVALTLDGGPSASTAVSTVLDVRRRPYRVLRDGLVDRARLLQVFGAELE